MDEIDRILRKEMEGNKTPSVQYIHFNKDNVIHSFRFGLADIKNQIPVDENTTYNAYSVTKTFTALAVLQLAEQNKVDIKQPIKDYLPEFPYPPDITIHQLLTHSAGIPNPNPLSWIHLASEHSFFDRNQFFNNLFAKNKTIKAKPNEKYSYSNLGYVLLGQLIEKVSGVTYERYINENIIRKLNLPAYALGFAIDDTNRHATGYHKRRSFTNLLLGLFIDKSRYMAESVGYWKPFKHIYVNGASYGGLVGTPYSFVKYIQQLLQVHSILLSGEYREMLFTENHLNSNKASGMCLSWFKGKLFNNVYYAHAGGGGGYYCEIRMYPELELGSVVMFNRSGMRDERYLDKVDKYALAERSASS